MAGGRAALTTVRGILARAIAAAVDRVPACEPAFVRAGRATQSCYPLASLYYHAHTVLCARLRASGRTYRRLNIHAVDVDLDVTDHSARLRYFHGVPYEPEVTRRVVSMLVPGDVFIDIGANAGFFTVLGALRVGSTGRVFAFEPHPIARSALEAMVERNHAADRVEVVASAVGDRVAGAVTLHLTVDSVLSTVTPDRSPLRADFSFDHSIEVPLTTLDAWLEQRRALIEHIALIKIDVEGFENEAVLGMAGTLAGARRAAIICETFPGSGADRMLRESGFVAEPLETDARGFGNYLYGRHR